MKGASPSPWGLPERDRREEGTQDQGERKAETFPAATMHVREARFRAEQGGETPTGPRLRLRRVRAGSRSRCLPDRDLFHPWEGRMSERLTLTEVGAAQRVPIEESILAMASSM